MFGSEVLEPFEEAIDELGLTNSQSKLYRMLANSGSNFTARQIADLCEIPRQEVYLILDQLFSKGLIEKVIESPTKFKAVPVSILVERKLEKMIELKKEIELISSEDDRTQAFSEDKCQITLMSAGKPLWIKSMHLMREAKTTVDVLNSMTTSHLMIPLNKYFTEVNEATRRGVKFRFLIDSPLYEETLKTVKMISSRVGFDLTDLSFHKSSRVKFCTLPHNIFFSIFDSNQVIMPISLSFSESSYLLIKNSSLSRVLEAYFNRMWSEAQKNRRAK